MENSLLTGCIEVLRPNMNNKQRRQRYTLSKKGQFRFHKTEVPFESSSRNIINTTEIELGTKDQTGYTPRSTIVFQ